MTLSGCPPLSVLASPELVALVCSFQDGTPQEYLPFVLAYENSSRCIRYDDREAFAILLEAMGTVGIQWVHRHHPTYLSNEVVEYAAASGRVDTVEYLVQVVHLPISELVVASAAERGHLAVVQAVLKLEPTLDCTKAINAAAEMGHEAVAAFLLQDAGVAATGYALERAARHGHLAIVRLLNAGSKVDLSSYKMAMEYAWRFHHQPVMDYLHNECNVPYPPKNNASTLPYAAVAAVGVLAWYCV
ncbi:hypothetical protein ACHHYP_10322 [Achlya hypogyna]|uniref:Ankyrin repeat-containing domain n=1 Tax=Achlya hypogyna TaxID=1202772 RepID=A0A1V9YLS5_ACHHY|nr:hypothetical protein ACHHYP_10322 [Achlya hypogyna]